ncbi:hypothetical protein EC957_007052 [Mortierella hygrophila]|uniref:Uncharacterized protein n=1 Tax=Mortierella hygrophila TaxID=979708 RepID=A0A9P6EZ65_9FUNG|nr:hypothetical protein EC957_007052 [Mortierella hygrophila]
MSGDDPEGADPEGADPGGADPESAGLAGIQLRDEGKEGGRWSGPILVLVKILTISRTV